MAAKGEVDTFMLACAEDDMCLGHVRGAACAACAGIYVHVHWTMSANAEIAKIGVFVHWEFARKLTCVMGAMSTC